MSGNNLGWNFSLVFPLNVQKVTMVSKISHRQPQKIDILK
ncbi:hypothetical protein CWATWH8502_2889 [Crocosphaera watsonii WH 8502]|uniref:Uncharacterized protein n=3 Tax=Crocosphaera watsonii TaxID=263511 RepID=T2JR43_CROWT|nr:hypothetical protein CWATWH8502_2889 [Crocosphaera watsonii WH 8502]CCQ63199.1 hypothetical protein CWATWH0401_1319 [Crocosphaera watsonii WH 0401]CCQ67037.1 hypothetical protein CWATWH0402_2492 [Crocosphaera watsonii WH 0402]